MLFAVDFATANHTRYLAVDVYLWLDVGNPTYNSTHSTSLSLKVTLTLIVTVTLIAPVILNSADDTDNADNVN